MAKNRTRRGGGHLCAAILVLEDKGINDVAALPALGLKRRSFSEKFAHVGKSDPLVGG